jgi:hypothetical protein
MFLVAFNKYWYVGKNGYIGLNVPATKSGESLKLEEFNSTNYFKNYYDK